MNPELCIFFPVFWDGAVDVLGDGKATSDAGRLGDLVGVRVGVADAPVLGDADAVFVDESEVLGVGQQSTWQLAQFSVVWQIPSPHHVVIV